MDTKDFNRLKDEDKYLRSRESNVKQANSAIPKKAEPPKELGSNSPSDGKGGDGVVKTHRTEDYLKIEKSLDVVHKVLQELADGDLMNGSLGATGGYDKEEVLKDLNQIFTPILVQQAIEGDISDQIQEAFSEATDSVLMERDIIKFDNSTRMAILRATTALLIARNKNSEKYKAWESAQATANALKLEIQKEENDESGSMVQQYLVNVSTTNNSAVARDAATALLPQTQH